MHSIEEDLAERSTEPLTKLGSIAVDSMLFPIAVGLAVRSKAVKQY